MGADREHHHDENKKHHIEVQATMTRLSVLALLLGCAILPHEGATFSFCRSFLTARTSRLTSFSCRFSPTGGVPLAATAATKDTPTAATRDQAVTNLLDLARQYGPIGSLQSQEIQDAILSAARELVPFSDPKPARISLPAGQAPHELVYSASTGGSSGLLFGNVYGSVSQVFNDTTFVNSVEFGPVRLSLNADLKIKDDWNNKVVFRQTAVQVFGQTVVNKEMKGAGIWKYLFAGVVEDATTGKQKNVRVLETPSLFILTQDVE